VAYPLLSVRQAEAVLNRAFAEFEASTDDNAREFFLLKLQVLIFYYDVFAAMVGLGREPVSGFASAVALKSLVHNLYEYDQQLNSVLVPRILGLAKKWRKVVDTAAIKSEKTKWRDELSKLKQWKAVRNAATGHYGKDILEQVQLLRTLDQNEVLAVAGAFVAYSQFLFTQLPHKTRNDT
jgi:hypothetical protein